MALVRNCGNCKYICSGDGGFVCCWILRFL